MRTYEQYLDMVNDTIARLALPETPARLYQPITYTMTQGGKRLRPVLTLMATDAMGGDSALALQAAAGVEMFHTVTLLHDDVMDRAAVRRGQPTVHRKWNDNVAILSGDAMLTLATGLVAQVPGACLAEVLHTFNRTAMEIYEGQQHDMDFESRNDVTVEQYMHMIRLKTSVLLGCACRIGALIAGAPDDACQALYDVAVNTGLAFQLRDDVLDVWGDPKTFGKATGGDILNNKKTFLLISAQRLAQDEDASELRYWLTEKKVMPDFKVQAVTELYERLGVRQRAEQAIDTYTRRALDGLAAVPMSDEGREAFAALINRLVSRDH
jgi:geranylgeranyl diphosphate synthase type II